MFGAAAWAVRPQPGADGACEVAEGALDTGRLIREVFDGLLGAYGPQHWWPGETPFEVMVGAILTQNTAWRNVERAIANLKAAGLMSAGRLARCSEARLRVLVRPAGFFNQKAERLRALARWLVDGCGGDVERLFETPTERLREKLLALPGVGPETADSILLYAGGVPVFVVDAYTRRIFSRHGCFRHGAPYEDVRSFFEGRLPREAALFNEYHALLVRLGKEVCRPTPRCGQCPVRDVFDRAGRPALVQEEAAPRRRTRHRSA